MVLEFDEIQHLLKANHFGSLPINQTINSIFIDSRSLYEHHKHSLFVALKGPNFDSHNFIESLITKGVNCFIVDQSFDYYNFKNQSFLIVTDTKKALQKLAKHYREKFSFPLIAITGSSGKTITKEWLSFLLSKTFHVVKSPKSYNSQIGVPLSIFGIDQDHNFGVFEAGISQSGEMQHLQTILQPTIGVLTCINQTHDQGFKNQKEKLNEKLKLFSSCQLLIVSQELKEQYTINLNCFTWSFDNKRADLYLQRIQKNTTTFLKFDYKGQSYSIKSPFSDQYALNNIASCIAVLITVNQPIEQICKGIEELYPIEMRLQIKKAINNCLIIDDHYSNDLPSLKLALDTFNQQSHNNQTTVILSDLFNSGLNQKTLYKKVSTLLNNNKISKIITIGPQINQYQNLIKPRFSFDSTKEFLNHFNINAFQNETILIKGSRGFKFEEIITLLEEKTHETVLEVNLDAITHNLNFYKKRLKPSTLLMVMIKAFGYGNGSFEIAKHLEHLKIHYFGVAFVDEGIELRKRGIQTPIMVMNPDKSNYKAMITYNLEPEIYSINALNKFLSDCKELNTNNYPIHLKIDTGMHRLGFHIDELAPILEKIKLSTFVKIKSIFSHLAASNSSKHKEFTLNQITLFNQTKQLTLDKGLNPIFHLLNTTGIINYPQAQHDMVRLGIGLYGIGQSPPEKHQLEKVSTLKSKISQIKHLTKSDSVGYDRAFIADKKMKIGVIPIGYADGITRSLSQKQAYVVINNKRAPIIGAICMDMLMVNLNGINCKENDQTIIFGEDPTIEHLSTILNTIPYEIISGISQRVKRIFLKN